MLIVTGRVGDAVSGSPFAPDAVNATVRVSGVPVPGGVAGLSSGATAANPTVSASDV